MTIYTPLQMPDTWRDRLADAYWAVRPAVVQWLKVNSKPMAASFAFGAIMAAAAVATI